MTVLIVACCNGNPGLLIVDTYTAKVDRINDIDTRGLVTIGDRIFFLTRQGLYLKPPNAKAKLIGDIAADWHGLLHHDNALWGVDPVSDTIVEWDMTGKFIQRWHWKPIGDHGKRLHTNDVQVDPSGKLWQCCFHHGICFEGKPMGYGMHRTPHSIVFAGNQPYWCASNLGQVFLGPNLWAEWPEAFTRGLAALDDGLVVGLSAHRDGAGGRNAQLKITDWTGHTVKSIDLPTNEVYAIARVRGT